jgi:hypothetical protein
MLLCFASASALLTEMGRGYPSDRMISVKPAWIRRAQRPAAAVSVSSVPGVTTA